MNFAPIVVFAFNRPNLLRLCLEALSKNEEAKDCDLFVFVDGARECKESEDKKVAETIEIAKKAKGFRMLEVHISEKNKGLGTSIISGVTEIINQYDKVIVVEDDLVVMSNFLSFMNQGLEKYKEHSEIFSVCGYSNIVKIPSKYTYDAYICPRSDSWTWATWKNRWDKVDWELNDWDAVVRNKSTFNKWGGSDCFGMLNGWKEGRNKSWAIRFIYSQFVQNGLSIFPNKSLTENNGYGAEATNTKSTWSRYKCELDHSGNKDFKFPNKIEVNLKIKKSAMYYYSLWIRAYSRLMYMIH